MRSPYHRETCPAARGRAKTRRGDQPGRERNPKQAEEPRVEALAQKTIASFSRQQELEADQIGIRVSAKAGFDPYGAARFLGALGRSAALRSSLMSQYANTESRIFWQRTPRRRTGSRRPSTPLARSAPQASARPTGALSRCHRRHDLATIPPKAQSAAANSCTAARLAFLAPEGFVLENASQALLGIKAGGAEALRLDSVRVPQTTPLTAYIASGWIDGLIASSIETPRSTACRR